MRRRHFLAGSLGFAWRGQGAKIRAGCQTRAYGVPIRGRAQLLAVLDELAATGYEGFETNFASLEPHFDDPAPLRAEFEKRGIALIGLHLGAKLHDAAAIGKERAQVERVARATRAFGGTHLMLSGTGLPTGPDGALVKEPLERKCAELNRAGRFSRNLGLRLCSHNHAQELERDAMELKAVLAGTNPEDVSLVVDTAYVHLAGLSSTALIRERGPRIAGLHVRDMKGKEEALPGAGEIDYRALGEALRQTGWSGWVILEMNRRKDVSSREMVAAGRAYLRDVMKI